MSENSLCCPAEAGQPGPGPLSQEWAEEDRSGTAGANFPEVEGIDWASCVA